MTPLEALERIAYLLERGREPTYRVRAFRGAADALRPLGDDEVAQLAASGRLRTLAGVGEKTERVILEALAGQVPAYLAKLEGVTGEKVDPAADALLAALRGDCHVHSDWSDGGGGIAEMAVAARDLGHEYIVLTDHSPRLTVAKGLSADRLRRQLDVVAALNEELAPFRILTGIEVDVLEDGSLDQEEELLAGLDVVVASVHSKLRAGAGEMTARMVRAMENPLADILGHCTGRIVVGRGRPESQFDWEAVFGTCLEHDKAVEINSRPERLDPPRRLLREVVALGCKVALDTDAHAPGQLEWQHHGADRAVECGVDPDSVVNTWSAEALAAWAGSHQAAGR